MNINTFLIMHLKCSFFNHLSSFWPPSTPTRGCSTLSLQTIEPSPQRNWGCVEWRNSGGLAHLSWASSALSDQLWTRCVSLGLTPLCFHSLPFKLRRLDYDHFSIPFHPALVFCDSEKRWLQKLFNDMDLNNARNGALTRKLSHVELCLWQRI